MNDDHKFIIEVDSRFIFPLSEITCSNLDEFKEAPTMQVTYNGFTGKLLKMEFVCENYYDITIYEAEKEAKVSFSGVKLEDVKFLGGEVSFT